MAAMGRVCTQDVWSMEEPIDCGAIDWVGHERGSSAGAYMETWCIATAAVKSACPSHTGDMSAGWHLSSAVRRKESRGRGRE
jgi:hypothetical protein